MAKFNFGNWIKDTGIIKTVSKATGTIGNKFFNIFDNQLNNFSKISSNTANFLGGTWTPYLIVGCAFVFLYYRTGGGLQQIQMPFKYK